MQYLQISRIACMTCGWIIVSCICAIGAGRAIGDEAETGLPSILQQLESQSKNIQSLHIHVRRTTEITGDPKQLVSCPFPAVSEIRSETDDVLEAFKGGMRYRRVMELDCSKPSGAQSKTEIENRGGHYLDEGKAWTGSVLLERIAGGGSSGVNTGGVYQARFDYSSTTGVATKNQFPPSTYFFNTVLAMADPTCGSEADRNRTQIANVGLLLSQSRYEKVSKKAVPDEVFLVEFEAQFELQLPVDGRLDSLQVSDRIWLDNSHALAVAKRELKIGEWFARVVNTDFVEIEKDFWLPRHSEISIWPDTLAVDSEKPLMMSKANLLQWIVNEVPDDLFTTALTAPQRYSLFDQAPAFHWTDDMTGIRVEGWAARGVGIRVEHRNTDGLLIMLVVETPEQRFTWRPGRNRVTIQPSQLGESNGYAFVSVNVAAREAIVRETEMLVGMLQSRKELLGDRGEVERLFAYYPADPKLNFETNPHHADPLILGNAPLPTVFFTRRHWFDLQTGLVVARQCGCKAGPAIDSTYVPQTNIDYPSPESLSPDLFTFAIPANAKVTTLTQNATKSKPDNSPGQEP